MNDIWCDESKFFFVFFYWYGRSFEVFHISNCFITWDGCKIGHDTIRYNNIIYLSDLIKEWLGLY